MSAQDLLEVVIESLERLQARLQGETPLAQLLWNFGDRTRPKDEEALSDFVKDHLQNDLQQRGVIASREVEIRKGRGGAPGEETDIHVSAVRVPERGRPHSDVVRLIIETKGNWHSELLTAMKTQLVDRYLADNDCRHGLYLVGWFNSPQWDDSDSNKKVAMKYGVMSCEPSSTSRRPPFDRRVDDQSGGPRYASPVNTPAVHPLDSGDRFMKMASSGGDAHLARPDQATARVQRERSALSRTLALMSPSTDSVTSEM